MSQKFSVSSFLFLMFWLFALPASAATRTVCVHLAFNDDRYSCPDPGDVGAVYTCNPANGWSTAMGATLQLWDKDPTGGDEFIGYFVTGRAPGLSSCFTFEWEGAGYSNGEANPDVYIRYTYEASAQANGVFFQAQDSSGSPFSPVTWRNGTAGNADQYVAVDCVNGATCWINGGGILFPNSTGSSPETIAMGAVDGAAAALVPFVSVEEGWPQNLVSLRLSESACGTGCAYSATRVDFTWIKGQQAEVLVHEAGHMIHFRAWENEMGPSNDAKNNAGGWSQTSDEYEELTFTEGWATYVGVVAFWNPQNSSVVPDFGGFSAETNSVTNCAAQSSRVQAVIRGFWDVDDINNEAAHASVTSGYADATSLTTASIYTNLFAFASGTSDRQRQENDLNGPNAEDYVANAGYTTTQRRSFIDHNCLEGQDDN